MSAPPSLVLDPSVISAIRVAAIAAAPVAVRSAGPELAGQIAEITAGLASRHAGKAPGDIAGLQPARELYKAFGIDPTRTRPSSESLLRRVLQDKPFPNVSNAVDVCNLCSVAFLLPIGLYDAGSIHGAVTLRRGQAGESYPGIRKDDVHLDGRPVLVDEAGPFGNPTSDSLRTSVGESTSSLWMVIFAPARYPSADMQWHAAFARETMEKHLIAAGTEVTSSIAFLP